MQPPHVVRSKKEPVEGVDVGNGVSAVENKIEGGRGKTRRSP